MTKVSSEIIIESYQRLRNVWDVGKEVGLYGQSVHARLKRLGIKILDFGIKVKASGISNEKLQKESNKSLNSEPQNINIHIENSNVTSEKTKKVEAEHGIFNNWIVQLIGLLAAIVGLLVFFFN